MLNGGGTTAADLRDTGGRSDVHGHHRKHHLKHTYIMLLHDQQTRVYMSAFQQMTTEDIYYIYVQR